MNPVDEVLTHIKLPFELRDFQKEDANRFAPENSCGIYLDMGCGKTVVATVTGIYKLLHGYNTIITLVPASLLQQWYEWLTSLGLAVCKYEGSPKVRSAMDMDADFILMTFQIFQNDYDRIKLIEKPYYIVDEAQIMCNTDNVLYRMMRGGLRTIKTKIPLSNGSFMTMNKKTQYPRIADAVCLLTGTPVNSPLDAYGLIKITSPDIYANYNSFKRTHVDLEDDFGNPLTYKNLEGLHNNLVANAVIRETSDHLDMPEKAYNVIEYDLSPSHMKLYKKILDERMLVVDGKIEIEALEANAIYHLAQEMILNPNIAGYDKDPKGLEILDTLVDGVKQCLIFNNYVSSNEKVMARYGFGGCFGSVSRTDQNRYVEEFKEKKLKGITANVKSGGYGLNLQICSQVFYPELPITPRDFRQSEARVYRQGQKERVVITILVARGTIQQKLFKKIMTKDDVMGKVTHTKQSMRRDLMGLE